MQRSQRRAPQSRGPLTNHPTSLASSTLCGSHLELSCNRAATSRHGESWREVCVCECVWREQQAFVDMCVADRRGTKSVWVSCQEVLRVFECVGWNNACAMSTLWSFKVPENEPVVIQNVETVNHHVLVLTEVDWYSRQWVREDKKSLAENTNMHTHTQKRKKPTYVSEKNQPEQSPVDLFF